mmetsp:Transcript_127435/g.254609  ORF Transcript_127435/g.254609 Transcript_127435/m.254609 type:complete len:226 (-) Transcript_127435:910-1587(-)
MQTCGVGHSLSSNEKLDIDDFLTMTESSSESCPINSAWKWSASFSAPRPSEVCASRMHASNNKIDARLVKALSSRAAERKSFGRLTRLVSADDVSRCRAKRRSSRPSVLSDRAVTPAATPLTAWLRTMGIASSQRAARASSKCSQRQPRAASAAPSIPHQSAAPTSAALCSIIVAAKSVANTRKGTRSACNSLLRNTRNLGIIPIASPLEGVKPLPPSAFTSSNK